MVATAPHTLEAVRIGPSATAAPARDSSRLDSPSHVEPSNTEDWRTHLAMTEPDKDERNSGIRHGFGPS